MHQLEIDKLDMTSSYIQKAKQIADIQRLDFEYTLGDHVMKILLGLIFQALDNIDEVKNHDLCNAVEYYGTFKIIFPLLRPFRTTSGYFAFWLAAFRL